jgi:ring-1,2-phenylacetyl-CoA epoxidase subunit PaaD
VTADLVDGLSERVTAAVAAVDDPEMPGVSIVELGLVERLHVDGSTGRVEVGLVPTFTGCPALEVIRHDVAESVRGVEGVVSVDVEFLASPPWTIDRVSPAGRRQLADSLGVAVAIGPVARCPRCGSPTRQESLFGPTRCRSVHRCSGCGEIVEVMR